MGVQKRERVTGGLLSTGDNRSLRTRLVQLLLSVLLSGCREEEGARDPLYLQRGTKSMSC